MSGNLQTVTVEPGCWGLAGLLARDELGLTMLDWLGVAERPDAGFEVAAHLVGVPDTRLAAEPGGPQAGGRQAGSPQAGGLRRLQVRTILPAAGEPGLSQPVEIASWVHWFPGAAWHEREAAELYGVRFLGHPDPRRLLLGDDFEGHPLRKDFHLVARAAPWPGSVEPGGGRSARAGRAEDAQRTRRTLQPPGVPPWKT